MVLHSPLPRLLSGALAVLVGMTLVDSTSAAEPSSRPITTAAAAKVAALPTAALAQAAPAAPAVATPAADEPFLRTAKGRLATVLLAGALGYTFYSFSHDRVKSPAR